MQILEPRKVAIRWDRLRYVNGAGWIKPDRMLVTHTQSGAKVKERSIPHQQSSYIAHVP